LRRPRDRRAYFSLLGVRTNFDIGFEEKLVRNEAFLITVTASIRRRGGPAHPIFMRLKHVSLAVQASLYVLSGINHFWHSSFYVHIMPDHYAHPTRLVYLSGVAEIAGGAGLLAPATRRYAAAGIVLMLLVFLDVHMFMLIQRRRFPQVPVWLLEARIPFQFLLMAWALTTMRSEKNL
jgi:uncharacterized membrane protein